jgi:putative ABC transport system permease protein
MTISDRAGLPDNIRQDLRYAIRTMRKNPVFVTTVVLTLALAIGVNTAMFTVIRAVLLNPLAYPDPDRLVRISGGATPTRFDEIRREAQSFSGVGAYTNQENLTFSGGSEPEILKSVRVSASFLNILGIRPLRGQSFREEEDLRGAPPVAMISADLWRRRFASDPQIIGRTAVFAATPYTIVGVLPGRFQFPFPDLDVWLTAPSEWPVIAPKSRPLSPFLTVFGRVKAGVSLRQAGAEMQVIQRHYARAHPAMLDAKSKKPEQVAPLKEELVANVQSMLWLLFGAVGFVLLIACANVASLLLTRATSRGREFALRSAVGAGRSRLIGQLLTESILLSLLGGILGVLLARLILEAIPKMTALQLPRATEIHMDWIVIAFVAALSIATGVLFGLAPALGASRPDLIQMLRASGESSTHGLSRSAGGAMNLRSVLSSGQVALSIVLLIGVVLLIESVAKLRGVVVGFNPANLLVAGVNLPPLRYDTGQKVTTYFDELAKRVRLLPGVRDAAVSMTVPMMGFAASPVQDAAKPPLRLNERLIAKIFPVSPGYFRTLEIALRRGREFTVHDTNDAHPVAVIDESLARRFWPAYPDGQNPVGQHLLIGGVNPTPAEIVGIVADVHQNLDSWGNWRESVYVAFAQNPQPSALLTVRTSGAPLAFARAVRDQVRALDQDQPVSSARTMEDQLEAQVGQRRLLVILLGSFAALALLLALVGIYGVIAYAVAQRVQEIGIRRALGAQERDILRLMMGRGAVLALVGIIAGVGCALVLTRLFGALLFQVSPTDPATFMGTALIFLLVALAATYLPARRATRIDPMDALRV